MKKVWKVAALVLAVLMIVTAFAACGNNDDDPKTSSSKKSVSTACNHSATEKDDFTGWKIVQPATCGTAGRKEATCPDCGKTVPKTILPTGEHQWEDLSQPATCQHGSITGKKCSFCDEEQDLEEHDDKLTHKYTETKSSDGKYVEYVCEYCETAIVRPTPLAKEYAFWGVAESASTNFGNFDQNPYFTMHDTGLDPYGSHEGGKENMVAAMMDSAMNCALWIETLDSSFAQAFAKKNYVLSFDIMFEAFPAEGERCTLLALNDAGCGMLWLDPEGYIGFVSEEAYQTPIQDCQMELNKWYNFAIVVRQADGYEDANGIWRLPFDLYIDGVKIPFTFVKEGATVTAKEGAAGGDFLKKEITKYTFRISDAGYGSGGGGAFTHRMAFDNLRIYEGSTPDKTLLRGTISFPNGHSYDFSYPDKIEFVKKS